MRIVLKFYVASEVPLMMDVMESITLEFYIPPYVQALKILCQDSGITLWPGSDALGPGSEIILSLGSRNILCLGSGNYMSFLAVQH